MIASSIVGGRLNYCNSLLFGTTACNLNHLQRVQNPLAHAVLQKPFSARSTELRRELHRLPLKQRIEYKIAAITYNAKHSGLPVYLHDLFHDYQSTRTLRSSTANKLQRPPSSVRSLTGSFRLQLNCQELCRHQPDPLTLLVLLNLDLKPICLRQHTVRFRFACD